MVGNHRSKQTKMVGVQITPHDFFDNGITKKLAIMGVSQKCSLFVFFLGHTHVGVYTCLDM